jgi:hypothetical protein
MMHGSMNIKAPYKLYRNALPWHLIYHLPRDSFSDDGYDYDDDVDGGNDTGNLT